MPEEPAVSSERVKDLQERVEALARSLTGSVRQQQQQSLVQGERGVENVLCADGYDFSTGSHKV